jgi:hypothetical protein
VYVLNINIQKFVDLSKRKKEDTLCTLLSFS